MDLQALAGVLPRPRLSMVRGLAVSLVALATFAGASAAWGASTAPLYNGDFPDPFVTVGPDGRHYAYSTQVGRMNVPVMSASADLTSRTTPVDALPKLPSWAGWGHTWAPAVAKRGKTWVMWYTTRHAAWNIQCISVATSSSPTGPFRDRSSQPLICQRDHAGSIDPSPFVAPDGKLYLHWKSDGNAIGRRTHIWGQQLSSDGLKRVGTEVVLLSYDAGTWEEPLIEGPSMARVNGQHHLFFGGGWWESAAAGIGYAVCAGPLEGCTKKTVAAPWMGNSPTKAGPAGPSLFTADSGATWKAAYHAWEPGRVGYANGGRRALWVDTVDFSSGAPVVA